MHPRLAEEWQDIVCVYPDAQSLGIPERVELSSRSTARTVQPGSNATRRHLCRQVIEQLVPMGFLCPLAYR